LKIIVHRGTHQIGGTCIEISSGSSRIALDAGLPLEAGNKITATIPNVEALFGIGGTPFDRLVISHAHGDHTGLIAASRPDVPVWMTQGTSKMMLAGICREDERTSTGAHCDLSRVLGGRVRPEVPNRPDRLPAFKCDVHDAALVNCRLISFRGM